MRSAPFFVWSMRRERSKGEMLPVRCRKMKMVPAISFSRHRDRRMTYRECRGVPN